jgi:hypothetical protein
VALAAGLVGLAGAGRADDKADPTGTWTWTVERGGQKREVTLTLKTEGGKLVGTVSTGKGEETKIEDARFADGELKFSVTRERDGEKFTSKYKGKLTGDAIKGSYVTTVGGKEQTRDWEAKRKK